jgi:hypothetical protein
MEYLNAVSRYFASAIIYQGNPDDATSDDLHAFYGVMVRHVLDALGVLEELVDGPNVANQNHTVSTKISTIF